MTESMFETQIARVKREVVSTRVGAISDAETTSIFSIAVDSARRRQEREGR